MIIYNLKLNTGVDIVGKLFNVSNKYLTLKDPVELGMHPEYGVYGKLWNNFNDSSEIKIPFKMIMFHGEANPRGFDYYHTFLKMQATILEETESAKQVSLEKSTTRMN